MLSRVFLNLASSGFKISSDLTHFLVHSTRLIAVCVFTYFIAGLIKLGFSVS